MAIDWALLVPLIVFTLLVVVELILYDKKYFTYRYGIISLATIMTLIILLGIARHPDYMLQAKILINVGVTNIGFYLLGLYGLLKHTKDKFKSNK